MNVTEYYTFQGAARSLSNLEDWKRCKQQLKPEYQYIFRRWLPSDRNAKIVEAACGGGVLLGLIHDDGYTHLQGTDSDANYVTLAQASGLPVEHRDSIKWIKDMAPSSLNVIVACNFYEHLPKEIFLDFLAHCWNALTPGGCLIMQGPNVDGPLAGRNLFNDITHHWAYTSVSLRALSQMTGFQNAEFIDGALSGIVHNAWIKRPIMVFAQAALKFIFKCATREHVSYMGSFLWVRFEK